MPMIRAARHLGLAGLVGAALAIGAAGPSGRALTVRGEGIHARYDQAQERARRNAVLEACKKLYPERTDLAALAARIAAQLPAVPTYKIKSTPSTEGESWIVEATLTIEERALRDLVVALAPVPSAVPSTVPRARPTAAPAAPAPAVRPTPAPPPARSIPVARFESVLRRQRDVKRLIVQYLLEPGP
jgi:hypothetical protein